LHQYYSKGSFGKAGQNSRIGRRQIARQGREKATGTFAVIGLLLTPEDGWSAIHPFLHTRAPRRDLVKLTRRRRACGAALGLTGGQRTTCPATIPGIISVATGGS